MLGQRTCGATATQWRTQADHALHGQLRLPAQGFQRQQAAKAVPDQRQRACICQPLQQLRDGHIRAAEYGRVAKGMDLEATRAQAPGQRPDPGTGIPDAMQQQNGGSHVQQPGGQRGGTTVIEQKPGASGGERLQAGCGRRRRMNSRSLVSPTGNRYSPAFSKPYRA
ncbi:hypothetical protein D3C73_1132310 [compost metagenome]